MKKAQTDTIVKPAEARPPKKGDRRKAPRDQENDRRKWDRARGWVSPAVVLGLARLTEMLIVAVTGFNIWLFYVLSIDPDASPYHLNALLITAIAVPLVFQTLNLYSIATLRSFISPAARVVFGLTGLFACLTTVAFFTKLGAEFSRVWLASWYFASITGILVFRALVALFVRRWSAQGRLDRSAVIIGGGEAGVELIKALEASPYTDIRIIGIFDDRDDKRTPAMISGHRKLGTINQLLTFARKVRVDLLIVSFPITAENRLLEVLKKLWVLPVDIRLSAHTNKLRFRPRTYSYIGNVPFIDVFDKPLADWDYVLKSIEDRVLSAIALVLLSPVMLLVALAVKLDSKGPVLFKQKRFGFNNELIEIYKFRSLFHESADGNADKLVTKNDDRVTRVGRFIRKTSLDELPQLYNALKGELSMVGPRPHAVMAKAADELYTEVVDSYFARHKVKPGITGWAQINGWRGETDTPEKIHRRVEHDLYYIENWSLWLDIYILMMTPLSLINSSNNAY